MLFLSVIAGNLFWMLTNSSSGRNAKFSNSGGFLMKTSSNGNDAHNTHDAKEFICINCNSCVQ